MKEPSLNDLERNFKGELDVVSKSSSYLNNPLTKIMIVMIIELTESISLNMVNIVISRYFGRVIEELPLSSNRVLRLIFNAKLSATYGDMPNCVKHQY